MSFIEGDYKTKRDVSIKMMILAGFAAIALFILAIISAVMNSLQYVLLFGLTTVGMLLAIMTVGGYILMMELNKYDSLAEALDGELENFDVEEFEEMEL